MKQSTVGAIAGAIGLGGVIAFAGAFMWLGRLENRVEQLEKISVDLALGPRGENCQQIVGKLVERPNDKALRQLADEWGCSTFAAATGPAGEEHGQVEGRSAVANADGALPVEQ